MAKNDRLPSVKAQGGHAGAHMSHPIKGGNTNGGGGPSGLKTNPQPQHATRGVSSIANKLPRNG